MSRYCLIYKPLRMQSVAVLISILVLCCMASARRGMHKLAIRHLEARQSQNCSILDVPISCLEAFGDFDSNDTDVLSATLDVFCGDHCVGPLNDFFECLLGYSAQYVCERQNGQYCIITVSDLSNTCEGDCPDDDTCPDACRRCVSPFVDDLSCCINQYRSYSFVNISELEEDPCGNRYNTCSGGAIAVPTVLTALLLMVMAAIAM